MQPGGCVRASRSFLSPSNGDSAVARLSRQPICRAFRRVTGCGNRWLMARFLVLLEPSFELADPYESQPASAHPCGFGSTERRRSRTSQPTGYAGRPVLKTELIPLNQAPSASSWARVSASQGSRGQPRCAGAVFRRVDPGMWLHVVGVPYLGDRGGSASTPPAKARGSVADWTRIEPPGRVAR